MTYASVDLEPGTLASRRAAVRGPPMYIQLRRYAMMHGGKVTNRDDPDVEDVASEPSVLVTTWSLTDTGVRGQWSRGPLWLAPSIPIS